MFYDDRVYSEFNVLNANALLQTRNDVECVSAD